MRTVDAVTHTAKKTRGSDPNIYATQVSDGQIFPETPSWSCGETGKRKGRRKEKE